MTLLPRGRGEESMKIVLFGATGNVGARVAQEARRRGHEVVGVVRDPTAAQSPAPGVSLVQGDATDPARIAAVTRGADAVVNAISPRPNARGLPAPSLAAATRALLTGLRGAGVKRLLVMGGAGSLEVSPGHALVDQPGFPDAYKAEALAQREALQILRAEAGDLDWTYLSPAVEIHPGARTGSYRTTGDQILADAQGKSTITYEDCAVALVDELERPKHVQRRFGVAY
jgi:putative NADH-flavin reductase